MSTKQYGSKVEEKSKSGKNTSSLNTDSSNTTSSSVAEKVVGNVENAILSTNKLYDVININGNTLRNGEGYTSGSGRKITLNLKEDVDLTEHQPLYPFVELSIGGVVVSDFGDNISDCVIDFNFDRVTSADSGFASSRFTITLYDDTALEIEELLYSGLDTRDYTSGGSMSSTSASDYEVSTKDGTSSTKVDDGGFSGGSGKIDGGSSSGNKNKRSGKNTYTYKRGDFQSDEPLGPHGFAGPLGASAEDTSSNGSSIDNSNSVSSNTGDATSASEKAVSDIKAKEYKELFDKRIEDWKGMTEEQLEDDEDYDFFRKISGISPKTFLKYIAQGDDGIAKMKKLYNDRLDKFIKTSNSVTGDIYSDVKESDTKNLEVDYGWANREGRKIISSTIKGNYTKYQIEFEEGSVNLTIEGTVQSMVQAGNVKSEFYDGETYHGSPSEIVQHICETENIPIGKIEETTPLVDDEGNAISFSRNNCSADRFIVNRLCEEATSAETGTVGFVFFIGEDNKAYFVATNKVGELGVKAKSVSGVDRSSYGELSDEEEEETNLGYSDVLRNSFEDVGYVDSSLDGKVLGVSFPTVGQLAGTNKDVIIVGDSRTNCMRIHSHGGSSSATEYDGVNSEGVRVVCKGGSGYKWLKDVAIPKIDKYSKSGTRICLWQGCNDSYREQAANMASRYVELLNPKIQQWISKGCSVIYGTLGPVKGLYTLNGYHMDDNSINLFTNTLKSGLKGVQWIDLYSILRKHTDAELFPADKIHYYSKSINMEIYNSFVSGAASSSPVVNGSTGSAITGGASGGVYENVEAPEDIEITGYYEYNSGKRNNKVISFSPDYKDIILTAKAMMPSNVYSVDPLKNQMFECTIDHGESSDVMQVVKDKKYLIMGMSSSSYSKLEKVAQSMYDRYQSSMYDASMEIMGDPMIKVFKWIYVAVFTKHGFLHHSSGIYFIRSASDSISRGDFTTTLSLQKLGSEKTMNMSKEEMETVTDSPVVGNSEIRAVSGEWSWPLPAGYTHVSSPFGPRSKTLSSDGFHSGIDLSAPGGTEILASKAGTVFSITRNGSQIGNSVTLKHDGEPVAYTAYHHMSRIGDITEGQQISQGQVIGYVGSTGHSTGNHLHFEIRIGGNRRGSLNNTNCVDPLTLLTKPG